MPRESAASQTRVKLVSLIYHRPVAFSRRFIVLSRVTKPRSQFVLLAAAWRTALARGMAVSRMHAWSHGSTVDLRTKSEPTNKRSSQLIEPRCMESCMYHCMYPESEPAQAAPFLSGARARFGARKARLKGRWPPYDRYIYISIPREWQLAAPHPNRGARGARPN